MIFEIPGYKTFQITTLVFDYNGTLATDGKLPESIHKRLIQLSKHYMIYILTADTFGSVKKEISNIPCELHIITGEHQAEAKANFIETIQPEFTAAFGNGANDVLMLEKTALGICIIGKEGAFAKALMTADLVFNEISDALECFQQHKRFIATLRR
ncbi:haloacid dehalogenase [bacterium]|nr:haloacid dehalogenase [candidate division CSSED10-310 bacterium]